MPCGAPLAMKVDMKNPNMNLQDACKILFLLSMLPQIDITVYYIRILISDFKFCAMIAMIKEDLKSFLIVYIEMYDLFSVDLILSHFKRMVPLISIKCMCSYNQSTPCCYSEVHT